MAEPPSSPPTGDTGPEDALAWYKAQYEQLEIELADFRESSRELEGELEKDLDAADKRERALQEKAEGLAFEVEEWKTKYRESKAEANAAQNTLEKEVTSLRDTNRTLQLKLRDIEVANDDYARQARNTTSSLDDLESKYNVAIERAVLLEEEVKIGEQERETLRIESQRLKDELSDLKIETDILQGKLKKMDEARHSHHLSVISTDISLLESPTFDRSPDSTASSPLITTPPDLKSVTTAETVSELQDPPSPPMSDASVPVRGGGALLTTKPTSASSVGKHHHPPGAAIRTPAPSQKKSRLPSADHSVTPKPKQFTSSTSSRPPGTRVATTSAVRTPAPRTSLTAPGGGTATKRSTSHKIPNSTSLSHIRHLTAQVQRLEARVHSARSKLPAPVNTPPRASPRNSIGVPSTVTIRSRKRTTTSSAASSVVMSGTDETTPTNANRTSGIPMSSASNFSSSTSSASGGGARSHVPRLSTSGVSRLSFGPLPNRNPLDSCTDSRPSSRASVSSYRPGSRAAADRDSKEIMPAPPRPLSRAGARTPGIPRPRSSLGGSLHGHSASLSMSLSSSQRGGGGYAAGRGVVGDDDESADAFDPELRTPSRRSTYGLDSGGSGIPLPSSTARRQSGGGIPVLAGGVGRRTSSGGLREPGGRDSRVLEDLGETY